MTTMREYKCEVCGIVDTRPTQWFVIAVWWLGGDLPCTEAADRYVEIFLVNSRAELFAST